MAEGFACQLAPTGVRIWSAGVQPAGLNPRVLRVMAERGIDVSTQRSKDLKAIPLDDVDTVVTLCGDAAERCPVWPGGVERIHWALPDPARAAGSEEEILFVFRSVRDEIERRVRALFAAHGHGDPGLAAPRSDS